MPIATARMLSLRTVLQIDAAASGGMGVLLLVAAGSLASVFGLPVLLLRGAGVILVPFAAFLVWLSGRTDAVSLPRNLAWTVVTANALWAIDSVLLLFTGWVQPTGLGLAFVLVQALAVVILTWAEIGGIRAVPVAAGVRRTT
jgi:hypothetical protein